MKTGEKGLELIKHFEGLRLWAYQCSAHVWTIGYGHTAGVRPGDEISTEQADDFLQQDIAGSERSVGRYVTVPLKQCQFDALVSFAFNLGSGNLRTSTLLKNSIAGTMPARLVNFCAGLTLAEKGFPAWYFAVRPRRRCLRNRVSCGCGRRHKKYFLV